MGVVLRIISVKVTDEQHERYTLGARSAGLVSKTDRAKVSTWLRALADEAFPPGMPLAAAEQALRQRGPALRKRAVRAATGALPETASVAPPCAHVAVGVYCKRCGLTREA